jgi:hypothetical protein
VNARVAGVGSVFFAWSVALTSKVWEPGESGVDGVWLAPGPEQAAYGWESKWHSKVKLGSLELKPNVGVCSVVEPDGPLVIVVCGAVESST